MLSDLTAKICRTEVGTEQICPGQVRCAQIGPVEARTVEIRIAEVRLPEILSLQNCTTQVTFRTFVSRCQSIQSGIQGFGFYFPVPVDPAGAEMDRDSNQSIRCRT